MFELRLTEVIPVTQSYLKTVATANVACLLIYIKTQSKLGVVMLAFNPSAPKRGIFVNVGKRLMNLCEF